MESNTADLDIGLVNKFDTQIGVGDSMEGCQKKRQDIDCLGKNVKAEP